MRRVLGMDTEGRLIEIPVAGDKGMVGGGSSHSHDDTYAKVAHDHGASGGAHPDLAAHETLGLAPDDHTHDTSHVHADLVTDADLSDHAATAHGLSQHAIDGAYHAGTEVLPTTGQKNALAGTNGTPGTNNRYVTDTDSRMTDARTPAAHVHAYAATTHTHAQADVTSLVTDLAGKAASGHAHDYAASAHTHTLADADIPAAIARDTEVTAAISAHLSAAIHGGSSAPVYADLGTATALALATNDVVKVTPSATATLTTTVPAGGKERAVILLQNSTTAKTMTFGTGFKPTGTLALGTTASRVFVVRFVSDGTNLYEASRTAAMVA